MDDMTRVQEKLAHLSRAVDDLSDVVARQEKELVLLGNRVRKLMEREAERELDAGGSVALGDQRPPHY